MLNQLPIDGLMTHMPFQTVGLDGKEVLFFCRTDDTHKWKIFYLIDGEQPVRLETGTTVEVVECSPTAWQDASGWHVTFICGDGADDPTYHLYRMDGPSLDQLSKPVIIQKARSGFIYKSRLVFGEVENIVHVRDGSGDKILEFAGAYIYRVSYIADDPDKLLISGQWIQDDEEVFCIEYDLQTDEQNIIECDGKPAYKCSIFKGNIIFADRCGEHFESRELVETVSVDRYPGPMAQKRLVDDNPSKITTPKNCGSCGSTTPVEKIVRPSCLECAEKHLGAAYVLLAETVDGYAHRLRAIGHLHEAEDESQEWSMLHKAIREARKAYQTKGTMPDWDLFEFVIKGIRDYEK